MGEILNRRRYLKEDDNLINNTSIVNNTSIEPGSDAVEPDEITDNTNEVSTDVENQETDYIPGEANEEAYFKSLGPFFEYDLQVYGEDKNKNPILNLVLELLPEVHLTEEQYQPLRNLFISDEQLYGSVYMGKSNDRFNHIVFNKDLYNIKNGSDLLYVIEVYVWLSDRRNLYNVPKSISSNYNDFKTNDDIIAFRDMVTYDNGRIRDVDDIEDFINNLSNDESQSDSVDIINKIKRFYNGDKKNAEDVLKYLLALYDDDQLTNTLLTKLKLDESIRVSNINILNDMFNNFNDADIKKGIDYIVTDIFKVNN